MLDGWMNELRSSGILGNNVLELEACRGIVFAFSSAHVRCERPRRWDNKLEKEKNKQSNV